MLKNLAKKLTNNLGLKVLALLFAIALWIVVVNIDDPVKPAQYTISVTQDNMDYLTSNGKYSEALGGKNTVTFTASAKRSILEKLSNTDFTAVADMEKIEYVEGDGICRVPITITCSKYNSNTVTISSKQQYLDVTVEDLGNVQKKITANTEGTVMNGCALGDVSIVTSNLLKISGPSSVTSQISTVVAINVDGMSSDVTDTVVPVLYDADGNEIDASKLKMNINTVTITAQILNTKDVDLSFQTKGNVASGYTLKGITYSPKKVRIKGETDVLNKVTKITIPDEVLDMSGATEDVETTVDITSYLPDGTSLVLAADAKVEVKVKVEPITTKTFEVDASAFTLENIPDEAKAKITEETIEVEITGAESDIKKLSADDITGTVNLQGYGNGEHKVAADIDVDNELYQVKTVRIPVDITAENTENETKATESSKKNASKTE
jgi:YbbR domain-containing protein